MLCSRHKKGVQDLLLQLMAPGLGGKQYWIYIQGIVNEEMKVVLEWCQN